MTDFNQYWKNLIGGLAGAAVGGGASYLGTKQTDGESEEEFATRRRGNVGIGALAGGATGAAVPTLATAVNNVVGRSGKGPGVGSWLWNKINPGTSPFTAGAVEGAAVGGVAGNLAGGVGAGKKLEKWMTNLKDEVSLVQDPGAYKAPKLNIPKGTSQFTAQTLKAQHGAAVAAGQAKHQGLQQLFNAAQARLQQATVLRNQFESRPFLERVLRQGSAEKGLLSPHLNAPAAIGRARRGGLIGAGIGGVAVPALSYFSTHE